MPPILEDEPSELLCSLIDNFNIPNDTRALSRIADNLTKLRSSRQKVQDEHRATLRLLSRKAEIAGSSLESSIAAAKARNHSEKMLIADRENLGLAKSVNELESTTHALEGQLARLREELKKIESTDLLGTAVEEDDGAALKLRLYRSMGIELEEDESGIYTKAIVRKWFLFRLRGIWVC